MSEDHPRRSSGDVWIGIALAFLLAPFTLIIPPGFFFIGLSQWVYLLPLVFWFRKKGRVGVAQGLLIGGGILVLLNAACFGILSSQF